MRPGVGSSAHDGSYATRGRLRFTSTSVCYAQQHACEYAAAMPFPRSPVHIAYNIKDRSIDDTASPRAALLIQTSDALGDDARLCASKRRSEACAGFVFEGFAVDAGEAK
jgi:hypothetical protein